MTVTITGTNDGPVIVAQDLAGAVTEQGAPSGNLTDSGVISFSDVDLTDVHLVSAAGTPVGATLGTPGRGQECRHHGERQRRPADLDLHGGRFRRRISRRRPDRVESFTISLDDQHGGIVTRQVDVTITGTNDAPILSAAAADRRGDRAGVRRPAIWPAAAA